MITQEEVKRLLHYDKDTGLFCWIRPLSNRVHVGYVPKPDSNLGYVNICIRGKTYRAHNLAWLYVTGDFPTMIIDHIDGNPSNNRINNLRLATTSGNTRNTRVSKNNRCGLKGVTYRADRKKWRASLYFNNKQNHLGYFDTKEEAYKKVCEIRSIQHGEFANHG